MQWHDLRNPNDPRLNELAAEYNLHPLHVEDCRNRNQAAKVEWQNNYVFVVLKPITMLEDYQLEISDLDIFIGPDWLITVQEEDCAATVKALDRLHTSLSKMRVDEIFYRLIDAVVDSYQPLIDEASDHIEDMGDKALADPHPELLEEIFDLKRSLMQLRRVLANTRDLVGQLLRSESELVKRDMMPFLRDVYDHLMRNLDLIEIHRDLLNGATELYLSSVANRTNQVMKAMTILGTIATPALVITGLYGMNLRELPYAQSEHSWAIVTGIIAVVSIVMLMILRRLRLL